MGSKKSDTQTVTTDQAPWTDQQPYLRNVFQSAQNLYNSGAGSFAGMNDRTAEGLWSLTRTAQAPNPVVGNAMQTVADTAGGAYLNSNPYLNQMWGDIAGDIQSRLTGSASGAGRLGSGAATRAMAEGLGDAAGQFFGQQYNQERGRQMQAASMAPQMDALRYAPAERLLSVGQAYEGYQQAANDDPWQRLARYSGIVGGGNWGSSGTQSQPIYRNPAAGALGGALAGSQIFPNNPLLGAAGGGLLGLLS